MKEILKVIKDPFKPLFMGIRAFIQTTKKGDALFWYVVPTPNLGMQQHGIPIHYQDYKNVFENKIVNTLP